MNKKQRLTFYKADFVQYNRILEDSDIKDQVASFLLRYVSLEAFYKKMVIAVRESNGKKMTTKEKRNIHVTVSDVTAVLKYFDIEAGEDLIERIFGSNDSNYMDCSIKKLRDRLVHNVNDNVLRVVLERYDDISADLEALSALLK